MNILEYNINRLPSGTYKLTKSQANTPLKVNYYTEDFSTKIVSKPTQKLVTIQEIGGGKVMFEDALWQNITLSGVDADNTPFAFNQPFANVLELATALKIFFKSASDVDTDDLGGGSFSIETKTITQGASATFVSTLAKFINAWSERTSSGGLLTPVGTIDPTSVSTNDANLVNGNFSDYCYNDSSAGTTNKPLPAMDLGVPKVITNVIITWYSATYVANNFKIQGNNSNSPSGWVDLVTGVAGVMTTQTVNIPSGTPAYRYYRIFTATGNDTSYIVVREMQATGVASPIIEYVNNNSLYEITNDGGNVSITNNTDSDADVTVSYC